MSYSSVIGWIGGPGNSGLTLTATLTAIGGAQLATGVSLPEAPSGSGTYLATYASFADGVAYRVDIYSTGAVFRDSHTVTPADALVAPESASIAAIKVKTDMLGSAQITVVSPVSATGALTLIQGEDYAAADGLPLDFISADGSWPNLTGATITFTMERPGSEFTKAGSVVVPTGANQTARVELTKAETLALAAGHWNYSVRAILSGSSHDITLQYGSAAVIAVPR